MAESHSTSGPSLNVAVVGATGNVGRPLIAELIARGHRVTAVTTHPELVASHPSVRTVEADANDSAQLVPVITGHDVVVTAIQYAKTDHARLISSVRESKAPLYFVTGGSGTLLVPGTKTRVMDTDVFPAEFAKSAAAAAHFWKLLEQVDDLDWIYLAPPPGIGPGERTGRFRRGGRELLQTPDGTLPGISFDDYAIAIVDELESPSHIRDRFTVAY
ncbi:NAD(P)-dependent oxidoreductase [Streptomyces sp. NBC_00076]|uniref:NAD(P)-dependent oxidoreductase n=1 Tax=Streptomyces sp. NBC_00076 TaxID=2975642 RepID=UPI003243DD4B